VIEWERPAEVGGGHQRRSWSQEHCLYDGGRCGGDDLQKHWCFRWKCDDGGASACNNDDEPKWTTTHDVPRSCSLFQPRSPMPASTEPITLPSPIDPRLYREVEEGIEALKQRSEGRHRGGGGYDDNDHMHQRCFNNKIGGIGKGRRPRRRCSSQGISQRWRYGWNPSQFAHRVATMLVALELLDLFERRSNPKPRLWAWWLRSSAHQPPARSLEAGREGDEHDLVGVSWGERRRGLHVYSVSWRHSRTLLLKNNHQNLRALSKRKIHTCFYF
jgi:hypothetical protein